MNKIPMLCGAAALAALSACSEFRERLTEGYPTEDVVIDKDRASPNQLADALNQIVDEFMVELIDDIPGQTFQWAKGGLSRLLRR